MRSRESGRVIGFQPAVEDLLVRAILADAGEEGIEVLLQGGVAQFETSGYVAWRQSGIDGVHHGSDGFVGGDGEVLLTQHIHLAVFQRRHDISHGGVPPDVSFGGVLGHSDVLDTPDDDTHALALQRTEDRRSGCSLYLLCTLYFVT